MARSSSCSIAVTRARNSGLPAAAARHRPAAYLICAALWAALALIHGYDFDYDILNYHYYNGFAVLHGRSFTNLQAAGLQTYFYPGMDALFYLLARAWPPMAVAAVLAAFQSLAFPMLYLLGRRLLPAFPPLVVVLLVALGAAAPVSLWEAGSPRGDTLTAVPVLAALCLVLGEILRAAPRPGRAALGGALMGVAMAAKLINAAFALGLLAAVAAAFPRQGGRAARGVWLRMALAHEGATVAAFLICYGPWGWALAAHFGNPVFPNFNQIFHSPYAVFISYADPFFALRGWRDALGLIFLRNGLPGVPSTNGLFDPRLAAALPACALALLAGLIRPAPEDAAEARRHRAARALNAFVLAAALAWLWAFPINRYLAAIDMLAPLAAIQALAALSRSLRPAMAGVLVLSLVLPLCTLRAQGLFWLPGDHRHGNDGGYFGVRYAPPPGLAGGTVALLGDGPITYAVAFLPPGATAIRLQGSLLAWNLDFAALTPQSGPAARRGAFGNAMGAAICRALGRAQGAIFLLQEPGAQTVKDSQALRYFGLAPTGAPCTPIASKARQALELCPAQRLSAPECDAPP